MAVVASVVDGYAGSRSRVGIVVFCLCGPIWKRSVREEAFREIGRRGMPRLDCNRRWVSARPTTSPKPTDREFL